MASTLFNFTKADIPINPHNITDMVDMVAASDKLDDKHKSDWKHKLEIVKALVDEYGYIHPRYRKSKHGAYYTNHPNIQGFQNWMIARMLDDCTMKAVDYRSMFPGICAWLFDDAALKRDYSTDSIYCCDWLDRPAAKQAFISIMFGCSPHRLPEIVGYGTTKEYAKYKQMMHDKYKSVANLTQGTRAKVRAYSSRQFNNKIISLSEELHIYLIKHDQFFYRPPKRAIVQGFDIKLGDFRLIAKETDRNEMANDHNLN